MQNITQQYCVSGIYEFPQWLPLLLYSFIPLSTEKITTLREAKGASNGLLVSP